MFDYLNTPFFHGLAVGLVLCVWLWVASFFRNRNSRKEMQAKITALTDELEKLRQHLHTQMQITAKGNEETRAQNEDLRLQNENLRVMVQGLQQKPERLQARTLEVWQRALDHMQGRAPGFASAWQQALAEAEAEVSASESGLTKFVRKFLGGTKSTSPQPATLTESTEIKADTSEV